MNYTELTTNIQDVTENTFTADQLAMFVQQAEQLIYNAVQIPALRKNSTGTFTTRISIWQFRQIFCTRIRSQL